MAHLIRADGTEEVFSPGDKEKGFALEEVQTLVGGYCEVVRLDKPLKFFGFKGGPYTMVLVDEEGKLKGKPVNYRATTLWWRSIGYSPGDHIVGDVLFVTEEEFQ